MTKLQKLQRYVGLVAGLAFLGFLMAPASVFMSPTEARYNELRAPKLTLVDNTVLSRKLFFGSSETLVNRMKSWSADIYACDVNPFSFDTMAHEMCIPARVFEGAILKPFDIRQFDASYASRFEKWTALRDSYYVKFDANKLNWNNGRRPLEKSEELVALEQDMAASIMSYANKDAGLYKVVIWLAHMLVLLIGALMVFFRKDVGSAILWPFGLAFSGLRKGTQVAKDLHEKI